MSPFTSVVTLLLLANAAFAAPTGEMIESGMIARSGGPPPRGAPGPGTPGPRGPAPDLTCLNSLKCRQPSIASTPVGQVGAIPPGITTMVQTMLGRGIQNYTCTGGAYVSAGALAHLYDASCVPIAQQATLPAFALTNISYPEGKVTLPATSHATIIPPIAIDHWFAANPVAGGTGIDPVFGVHGPNPKFTVFTKNGTLTSPDSATADVPWLKLVSVESGPHGALSAAAWRVNTAGGVAPSSCSVEGSTTSVQYAAMYYFAN